MSTQRPSPRVGAARLADGYRHALMAADVFFGAFVILMVVISAVAWARGDASLGDLLGVFAFLVLNVVLSEVSRRTNAPYHMEAVRHLLGGSLTAVIYTQVAGPLAPWWPGFMVLSLGGAIGFGLLTQRTFWGRVAVVYYLSLFGVAELLRPGPFDGYTFALHAGVIATVGLMFAEIMALLGRTMQSEHERNIELEAARDALFAEMEVAREIQMLLLPKEPQIADGEVVGRMLTATEVGGDYYDLLEVHDRTLLAIGDVSGHGVTSGLTMMMARTALVGAIESAPEATLTRLYQVLNRCVWESLRRMELSMYMTFALLEHLGGGRYRAVGRHLPLLIYRADSQRVEELELTGTWLGIVQDLTDAQVGETTFELQPGDLLFLYTDGIVEHFGGNEMYGFERLAQSIERHAAGGPTALVDAVLADLRRFSTDQDDDVTLLVVGYGGAANSAAA